MFRLNGVGTTLLGVSEAAPDGTKTATVWFTFLFLPIIPLRRLRVAFVPQEGSGFAFVEVERTQLSVPEILQTLLFCYIVIPVVAVVPALPAFKEIGRALGIPDSWRTTMIVIAIIWVAIVAIVVSSRHERRCSAEEQ